MRGPSFSGREKITLSDAVAICGKPSLKLDKGEDNYYDTYSSSSPMFRTRSYIFVSRSTSNATTLARATIAQAQAARASKGSGGSFGGGRSFGGGGGGHGGR